MNKLARSSSLITLIGFSLLCAIQAKAQVVISDTFDVGGGYSTTSGRTILGGTPFYGATAMLFNTSSFSGLLHSIVLPLARTSITGDVQITLSTSLSGLPGVVVETWSTVAPDIVDIVTLTSAGSTTLSPSTDYWIAVLPQSGTTGASWFTGTDLHIDSTRSFSAAPGVWDAPVTGPNEAALRVNGIGVAAPEPGTFSLLALGALGIVTVRRRKLQREA
jgi:PEP-CTERM motif